MKPRIFVQLGRIGDILNVLPLAKQYHDATGLIPLFMVAAEFASILDGVSYVQPFIYFGPWDCPLLALIEARKVSDDLVLCQIHGRNLCNPDQTASFARESWLSAGATVPWGSLPLVIDRRDPDREQDILTQYTSHLCGRKLILYAGEGTSSPFPVTKPLLAYLRHHLGDKAEVLDLSQIKAYRFFDLLGLFERASCLVAIDTAHQHLAAACPKLPVVALCTRDPGPWHGSPWRKEHVDRLFYDELPLHAVRLLKSVQRAIYGYALPKIIHVWCDWRDMSQAGDSLRRMKVAQDSWQPEYATGRWIPAEMKRTDATRDATDIGDPHNCAYIHDVMQFGLSKSKSDSDIICFSNADTGFTPGLTGNILEIVSRHGSLWTHRRDFPRVDKPFVSEAEVRQGEFYPGTDLIACSVAWWKKHRAQLADYLTGREGWDEAFRQLIKYHAGGYIEAACWHEWHESFWSSTGRWEMPGNTHNYKLREEWFSRTGFKPEDYRYFRVVEGGDCHPKPYPAEPCRPP